MEVRWWRMLAVEVVVAIEVAVEEACEREESERCVCTHNKSAMNLGG